VQASPSSANVLSILRLRSAFEGRLIAPDDPEYDQARTIFYGGFDRRPAAIVRPRDAGEVAKIVTLARDTGLELAVRSGAHSVAGHSVCEGGIVLDLGDMRALDLD
jgi:FAD/FMN-containing dehydrogenase